MRQFLINNKRTYDDWGLLLSNYSIESPTPKVIKVEIPYAHGSMDITQALTGTVPFNNRAIEINLILKPPRSNWKARTSSILAYCHGQIVKIYEPDDANYYYIGRMSVGKLEIDEPTASVKFSIDCNPYRLKSNVTKITHNVKASKNIILKNEQMITTPIIITSAAFQIIWNKQSFSVNKGTFTLPIILEKGDNKITVNGTGTIMFEYQEGAL